MHANAISQARLQLLDQGLRTHEIARDGITHPNRQRWRWLLILFHDIEVVIETGDFIHLSAGEIHLPGQGSEMIHRDIAFGVLYPVQHLNQQIGTTRGVAKQRLYLLQGSGLNLAAFTLSAPAFAWLCFS